MRQLLNIFKGVKEFLFSAINKDFFIFLFFLILSASYWLMSVLNDTMEREVEIVVQLTDVPKNVIILGEDHATVHAVVRDKGYTIATYLYGDNIKPVQIKFSTYARGLSSCYVTASEMQKLIAQQVYSSTKVISVKPEKVEFHYNHGLSKRVPVRLFGIARAGENYYLSHVRFEPDSVTIYASADKLDSIREVYTVRQRILNITDTIQRRVALRAISAVKIVPKNVVMRLYPDIMTEAITTVPVLPQNVPAGMILRTFPATAQVRYVVGASQYNAVDTASFSVVADYESTADGTTSKCTLRLIKAPRIARNPVILNPEVDYLLEQR